MVSLPITIPGMLSLTYYITGTVIKKITIPVMYSGFNSLTAIRVLAGTKNSRPVGFYSRNSTKSTINPNTTIHKHYHHGGAVRPSFGVRSMDPPDQTRITSSKGVRRGDG